MTCCRKIELHEPDNARRHVSHTVHRLISNSHDPTPRDRGPDTASSSSSDSDSDLEAPSTPTTTPLVSPSVPIALENTPRNLKRKRPSPKKPRQFLGSTGRLGLGFEPCEKLRKRLAITRTPIVDLLLGPAEQFGFDEKEGVVKRVVGKVRGKREACGVKGSLRTWHDKFDVHTTVKSSVKVRKFDFSGNRLRARLLSSFGIVDGEPQKYREHMEKQLEALVIANRESFPQLKDCRFFVDWDVDIRKGVKKMIEKTE